MWKYIALVLQVLLDAQVVEGLSYLHDIKHYEVVDPFHVGVHSRSKRDLSTKQYDNIHLDDTTFEIDGFGRHFKIKLHKNRQLLPASFVSIYQGENGEMITDTKPPENCFYHGKLEDRQNTFVVFSTCNGLRGLIHDEEGEEFFVEPLNDVGESHIMYNMKDLIVTKKGLCGSNHTHASDDFFHYGGTMTDHFKRKRRNIDNEKKYVEIVAVVDNRKFRAWGSSLATANNKAIELMNYVDMVYKTLNTRIPLLSVVVWNTNDIAQVTTVAGVTLNNFGKYTKTVLNGDLHLNADNAQLISGIDFAGDLVGLAGIGTICSSSSSAVNMDHSNNPATSANTIAHELGHNLGFLHNTGGCKCPTTPCVMNAWAPSSQVKGFTDCTSKTFNNRASSGNYPCLLDYPDKLFGPAKCGNGYKEDKEACDCGTEAECKASGADKCCDFKTCTLHSSAECADGLCCKDCKFKSQGALCREKFHSECDLEEFCVGNSSECQRNFYRRDGTSCAEGEGYCHQGICKTHTAQCGTLWGSNSMKAYDACFEANKKGNEFGNCGKDLKGDIIKCTEANMLCGKIQCKAKPGATLPNLPLIGSGRASMSTVVFKGSTSYRCTVAKMNFEEEAGDPTLVQEGTKCANNSICVNTKCTPLSSFSNIKSCNNKCKNGGVCNNNGNCHCPRGFACPYCEFAGVGGSLDSGQGCLLQDNCSCLTPLVKGLLVLFLFIIPLIILIAFCSYRHKEQLRARWRVYQETKKGGVHDTKASASFIGKSRSGGGKTNVKMQTTGAPSNAKPQIQNPYSTETQSYNRQPAYAPPPPPASSSKSLPPPKLPPVGNSSPRPGKLPQINAYNNMEKTPQVQIKKPYR